MMKNPERREDKRVINCARACPDVGQAKRSDDAGILRQMQFIVPNETGSAHARVGQKNQKHEQDRANQTHPPLDNNTRFTEGHCLTDGVGVALLSTPCSDSTVYEKNQADAAKISNPGKRLVRRRGFVSSAGKLANHRLDESKATGPQPKCDRLASLPSSGRSCKQ